MSTDKENNKQFDEIQFKDTIALPSAQNVHHDDIPTILLETVQHDDHHSKQKSTSRTEVATHVPAIPQTMSVVSSPDTAPTQRMRINRIIIRKRRHGRTRQLAPRVVLLGAVVLTIFASLFAGTAGAAFTYYQSQLPLLNGVAQHSLFQTTYIYDRNGHLLYELYDQQQDRGRRSYVNYNDISPLLIEATIAAEDRSFWTNSGVDPLGIMRALISNVQSKEITGGASTITQQFIKLQFFQKEDRTYEQKIREAVLATGLTQQYPKWKIMEMYLNTVYYGNLNYGVEAAAQDYFGLMPQCTKTKCKPAVAQLTLAQASLLAGLPQSPTYYDPTKNPEVALKRQKYVLDSLVEIGKITREQAIQAQKETEKYNFASKATLRRQNRQAPHFVDYVIDQLAHVVGAEKLATGGFKIYTTLDLELEKKVEQTVYDHLYKPRQHQYLGYFTLSDEKNVNNGAAVVINPSNGEILAMSGSAQYNTNTPQLQGQFNAATTPRQPGSSMKPIVYAATFEMGWYPAMIVPDQKTTYPYLEEWPDKWYTPQNYDGKFHTSKPMTIRTALGNSFNIPAVNAIMFAGPSNVQNLAARLGLSEIAKLPPEGLVASMALGSKEVSLLNMTGAYATFANQGIRMPPVSILKITDNQGNPIYKYDPRGTRAVSAEVAFLINNMLSDKEARYLEFARGNPLELDRPAAAKTGTTNSFRDNWTMGYTPHMAVGVWVGNSNNEEMHDVIGITGAGPIWHEILDYASKRYNLPADDFTRPNNVYRDTVSAFTGLAPRPGEQTVSDWFINGTKPTIQGAAVYSSQNGKGQKSNNDKKSKKR